MNKKKALRVTLILLSVATLLLASLGFEKTSADKITSTGERNPVSVSSTPLVHIYPNYSGVYPIGTVKTFEVRISSGIGDGAPQETHEPATGTDKTYAWEVIIEFDPLVIHVTTEPVRHTKTDWFNSFHYWTWDWDFGEWVDDGPYDTAFAKDVDNSAGRVSAWCSLMGETCTTTPLPEDAMGERTFPNAELHSGDYYDLPYTNGISTGSLETPGPWSGNYFMLYYFRVTTMVDISSEEPYYSWVHIKEARLWMFDAETLYPARTRDGFIGPDIAEFPLGIEYALGFALVAAVAYVWWTKRHKLQVVS